MDQLRFWVGQLKLQRWRQKGILAKRWCILAQLVLVAFHMKVHKSCAGFILLQFPELFKAANLFQVHLQGVILFNP